MQEAGLAEMQKRQQEMQGPEERPPPRPPLLDYCSNLSDAYIMECCEQQLLRIVQDAAAAGVGLDEVIRFSQGASSGSVQRPEGDEAVMVLPPLGFEIPPGPQRPQQAPVSPHPRLLPSANTAKTVALSPPVEIAVEVQARTRCSECETPHVCF